MSQTEAELQEMKEIIADFLVEANELIASLDENLVKLEETPRDLALLNEIFRAAHTIKGNSGMLGFTDVAQSILYLFEQPLRGVVYFIVLQGVAQALLIFMDLEDNTRRSARDRGRTRRRHGRGSRTCSAGPPRCRARRAPRRPTSRAAASCGCCPASG